MLGPLEVLSDGSACSLGGRKQRAVIAVLVAAAGRPVPVDSLLQAIYGDDASPNSRATLHTYVSNLRSTLGDVIIRRADSYLLDSAGAITDAAEFEDAYTAALQLGSPEDMATQLRLALSMWRGHPYADVEGHGYLDGQITRPTSCWRRSWRESTQTGAGRHRASPSSMRYGRIPFQSRGRCADVLRSRPARRRPGSTHNNVPHVEARIDRHPNCRSWNAGSCSRTASVA